MLKGGSGVQGSRYGAPTDPPAGGGFAPGSALYTVYQQGNNYSWDATAATVESDSASKVSTLLSTGGGGFYFQASVALQEAASNTPNHTVTVTPAPGGLDNSGSIPLPSGTQRGGNADHHCALRDQYHQREHDLWACSYGGDGQIDTAGGGISFTMDSLQTPRLGLNDDSATAARMPLRKGLVTPDDVQAGVIHHALVFSCNNPGPNPVYPSNSTVGYPNSGHVELGQWLRLAPSTDLSGLSGFDLVVATALKQYGMFCRDIGSTVTIYGVDTINQGGNGTVWPSVGLTLPILNAGYPYAYQFSGGFPWGSLQVLVPPAH